MQDDTFPAAEKILSDIENVIKKNLSLKSFEIVPAEDNENKSPVFHQENCLGLASWCVQPLYCYAYRRLLDLRQNRHRREEPCTIARWLLGAILLNPDVTTFWNMRRELVRCHKLDPADEMVFSRLVLYHKPKCYEAFAYRRWMLPYILDAKEIDPPACRSPLCTEIELAGICADKYANNYHAWNHRQLVMKMKFRRGYTHPTLRDELTSTHAWCNWHISDHSGLAYRQFVLTTCFRDCGDVKCDDLVDCSERRNRIASYVSKNDSESGELDGIANFDPVFGKYFSTTDHAKRNICHRAVSYWVDECETNEKAIKLYVDHEALWYHRRFLAHVLVTYLNRFERLNEAAEISDRDNRIEIECNSTNNGVKAVKKRYFPIVDAFCRRTNEIIQLACERNQHEKQLTERFVRYLADIGLQLNSQINSSCNKNYVD